VRSLVPEIILGIFQAGPVSRGFGTTTLDRDELVLDPVRPGLGQKLLDDDLRPLVVAFAESMMPDASFGIDEVESRPILVRECLPDAVVAVDGCISLRARRTFSGLCSNENSGV